MIFGIGTDIIAVSRLQEFWRRHGERGCLKLLAESELEACRASADPGRFLAKRFAAKEALGKALGTGIRAPLLLPAIAVTHDALGKPGFTLTGDADALIGGRGLLAHLSISDEQQHAVAFVVLEQR